MKSNVRKNKRDKSKKKRGRNMSEFIDRKKTEEKVRQMSPLTWAYVGDAVYELFIRTNLTNNTNLKPNKLHTEAIKYVKAQAQSNILKRLDSILSDDEKDIVRRGRNAQNHHIAKNATLEDYTFSTAFEALIGFLYLTRQDDRLKEILDFCII